MAKNLFEVLQAMLDADVAEGVVNGSKKYRVSRANDMLAAEYTAKKSGCKITMGIGSGPELIPELESGKKIAVLFIVDREEYNKFSKE